MIKSHVPVFLKKNLHVCLLKGSEYQLGLECYDYERKKLEEMYQEELRVSKTTLRRLGDGLLDKVGRSFKRLVHVYI